MLETHILKADMNYPNMQWKSIAVPLYTGATSIEARFLQIGATKSHAPPALFAIRTRVVMERDREYISFHRH